MKVEAGQLHPLKVAAQKYPSNPALCEGKSSLTYSDLYLKAIQFTRSLTDRGILPGQIVALDNLPTKDLIISIWACLLGKFLVFPVNTRFPNASIEEIYSELKPALVVSNSSKPDYPSISFSDLCTNDSQILTDDSLHFDESLPASLLMTSGSSGAVKFVQHSFHNHLESARGSNQNIRLGAMDGWILSLPLYHIGGLSILFRAAISGAAVIIPEEKQSTLVDIKTWGASHISLVPTQLQRLLRDPAGPEILKGMKAILIGGSAISKTLIQEALSLHLPIHVSYGSTEMTSQINTTTGENRQAALKNSGVLLSGRDLIISHEGEILVKGNTLAQGYLHDSRLVDLRDEEGWFHTGDVGYVNVQGELTVTGRMDNQFISGGENIQPEHIERLLGTFLGIVNAIVVPRIDEEFGARPVAFLDIAQPGIDGETLGLQLRGQLPGYMIPVAYFELHNDVDADKLKISRQALEQIANAGNNHLRALEF